MIKYFEIPLFEELSKTEKGKLIQNCVLTSYDKGDLIIKKGVLNNQVLLLVSGFVKLYTEDYKNKRVFDVLNAEKVIGILSLYNTNVHNVTAIAISEVQVVTVEKKVLSELLFANKGFQQFWLETISILANRYIQFLAFQNKKNVRGRIADVLLYLSENVYESEEFHQTLTRREFAELANTSTETVIRLFSEFKKDKIISINQKSIKILDSDYLNEMRMKG